MGIPMAALASSACFGLWHYNLPLIKICGITLIGLFLSWSYFKSKTILVPWAIHFSWDIVIPLIHKHL
jgi:membrane protease YdiL (CAAX protease family)